MAPAERPFAFVHVAVRIAHAPAAVATVIRKLASVQRAIRGVQRARAVLAIALPRSLVRVALRSVQAAAALATCRRSLGPSHPDTGKYLRFFGQISMVCRFLGDNVATRAKREAAVERLRG